MGKITHDDIHHQGKILVLTVLLLLSLVFLYINKSQSYYKYERIEFQSSGAILYANVYYPSKDLKFQEKRPLLIYCHGIGSHRDFDIRIPIEFAKRSFYVVALDYQGQGESGGNIINIDQTTNIPALAEDCSRLLDKLETMPFFSDVDTSQIGLIGHSLGGMVVLMNQALDHRFVATVAWAPLVNFDPKDLGIIQTDKYDKYIPVNLLNKDNTHNLLIIMHVEDETLDFRSQALVAQQLTGCTVIPITEPLIGGGHSLFSDKVLIESIKWFERIFFHSETINGPIYISFLTNYILIFITLVILLGIVLLLISYSSDFLETNIKNQDQIKKIKVKAISKPAKIKQVIKISLFSAIFILNWVFFESFYGLLGIFFASIPIIIIYALIKLAIYIKRLYKKRSSLNLKEFVISRIHLKYFIYLTIYTIFSLVFYIGFLLSYTYYAYAWAPDLIDFVLAIIVLIIIILTTITTVYGIITFRFHSKKPKIIDIKFNLKGFLKSRIRLKISIFSTVSTLYFIAVYLIFSVSYPFAFMWPSNFVNYILSLIVFPIYFSIEIFYRKVIYPQLYFLTEQSKAIVIVILAIIVQMNLIILTSSWLFLPSVIFTYFIFLIVIIQNTIIYEHTKSFNSVVLSSFELIQIFFSAVISNALGISAALHIFVRV